MVRTSRWYSLPCLVLMVAVALPSVAGARKRYDLKKVLTMGDRAKAKLPRSVLKRAVHKYGLKAVALRRSFVKKHSDKYGCVIPKHTSYKVRDQKYSGNCWIFSTGRVLASKLHKQGRKSPILSSSFVNYHSMRQTARALLKEAARDKMGRPDLKRVAEADEGGFEVWAMKIIKRQGFVPYQKMPLTADGSDPGLYLNRLQTLLGKAKLDFAKLNRGKSKGTATKRKTMLRKYEKQVDQMLEMSIGKPPKSFTWKGQRYTPKTFASRFLKLKPADLDYVTLTHYPTRGWNRRYKGGISPGMPAFDEYNVSMKVMQQAVKKTLRKGEAVLFGVNVSEDQPHRADFKNAPKNAEGILSLRAFNYKNMIPAPKISKRDKLKAGLWEANHAMAITGYDPGKKRGSVLKWKVENSHGRSSGDKGFLHMYDDFFRRHVEDVVVPRSAVPKHVLKQIEGRPRSTLKKHQR